MAAEYPMGVIIALFLVLIVGGIFFLNFVTGGSVLGGIRQAFCDANPGLCRNDTTTIAATAEDYFEVLGEAEDETGEPPEHTDEWRQDKCDQDYEGPFDYCGSGKRCPSSKVVKRDANTWGTGVTSPNYGFDCCQNGGCESTGYSTGGVIGFATGETFERLVEEKVRYETQREGHGEIEYEEDYAWGKSNVWYTFFNNSHWMWKSTRTGWGYRELNDPQAIQDIYSRYHDDAASTNIWTGLLAVKNSYRDGISVIENEVNKHDWTHNDDYIYVHYPDGSRSAALGDGGEGHDVTNLGFLAEYSYEFKGYTIEDFMLAQNTSFWQDFIKGWGDPEALIYYEALPAAVSNSWSGYLLWMDNIYDLLAFGWVVGKGFKLAGTYGGKLLPVTRSQKLTKVALEAMMGKDAAKSLGNMLAKSIGQRGVRKLAVKAGVTTLTGSSLAAAYLEDKAEVYNLYPNKLVIKRSMESPQPSGELPRQRPMIYKGTRIEGTGFYIASPCTADLSSVVSIGDCARGNFDIENSAVGCQEPNIGTYKISEERQGGYGCLNYGDDFTERLYNAKIAERIKNMLGDKEKLKFWWEENNKLFIRDPVTTMVYEFETDNRSDNKLVGMNFTDSRGAEQAFTIDNYYETGNWFTHLFIRGPTYAGHLKTDNEIEITWDEVRCKWSETSEKNICVVSLDAGDTTVWGSSDYYNELKNVMKWNRRLIFGEEEREIGGEIVKGPRLNLIYNEDGNYFYYITLIDNDDDGSADFISIDQETSAWTLVLGRGFNDIPDDVVLGLGTDLQPDYVSVTDCKLAISGMDLQRKETGDRNFCIAERDYLKSVAWWGPAIGGVVGAVVGGIFGVGAGAVPAAKFGAEVGLVTHAVYVVYEKAYGARDVWPGEVY